MGYPRPNIIKKSSASMTLANAETSIMLRSGACFFRVVQEGGRTNSLMRKPLWEWATPIVFGRIETRFWYWTPVDGKSLGILGDRRKRQLRGKERKVGIYTERTEDTENRRQEGQGVPCPYRGKKLGTEEDGFALEGFDGDEDGGGGVDAGGGEDHGDGSPVVGAGDNFLAD